jgi:hypothetical protein
MEAKQKMETASGRVIRKGSTGPTGPKRALDHQRVGGRETSLREGSLSTPRDPAPLGQRLKPEREQKMKRNFNPAKASRALKRAAQMPPLRHKLPEQDFDILKSEVVRWLSEQPEIAQALFDWCHDKGAIVFRDGRWHGVENNQKL